MGKTKIVLFFQAPDSVQWKGYRTDTYTDGIWGWKLVEISDMIRFHIEDDNG